MFTPWLWKNKSLKGVDLRTVNKPTPWYRSWPLFVPALVVISAFTFYPLVIAIIDSINHPIDPALPGETTVDFKVYKDIWNDDMKAALKNSTIYAIISVPLGLGISLLISTSIAFIRSKFIRSVSQTVFFLPYITSAVAIAITFAYIFDWDYGLMNTITKGMLGRKINWLTDANKSALPAMLIFGVWRSLAFNILILTTALLSVPKDRLKAASIDSAGSIIQFFRIILPSIKGTLKYLITIGIIGAVKVFPLALFGNNSNDAMHYGGQTMMMVVFNFAKNGHYPQAGAASVYLLAFAITVSYVVRGGVALMIKTVHFTEAKILDSRIKFVNKHRRAK